MQTYKYWIILSFVALTGCDAPGPVGEAHKAVRAVLVDPGSAKFSSDSDGPGGVACGFVNAKNRMGGFSGDSPYVYSHSVLYMISGEPKALDLEILTNGGSDFKDRWMEVEQKCDAVLAWEHDCPEPLKSIRMKSAPLCKAWKDTKGSPDETLRALQ